MIIKCKMCGGDIEFVPGATYGTCEYCGSTSTIPQADDEQKLNRYNRANHLRRQCEFDKALAAYEKILEQDDTDAEAHWGAALSRYGIEYVEDPATKKRVPTCHRLQVASMLADADYLAAVENAPDAESRRLYEEQAAQIAEIQKGILAISATEKPYDVFICYKETDENGQRTRDSQWAQDVYYGLTDAGYKVFFSRITLEDKLGRQYEPYIFAALNSARVMIVIGSRPEYFNAVWVKNEWSRYLALMANDRTRLLIPCYRDMDPYDLPEELSALQSQDMSKIGFMQDLVRGIEKCIRGAASKKPKEIENAQAHEDAAVKRLLQNGTTYLKLSNYDYAEEVFTTITKNYPEEYGGWWGLIVCKTRNFSNLILDQEGLNLWFGYVRQLSSPEKFEKIEKQYVDYTKKVSQLAAAEEMKTINAIIGKYNSEIQKNQRFIQKLIEHNRENEENSVRNYSCVKKKESDLICQKKRRSKKIIGMIYGCTAFLLELYIGFFRKFESKGIQALLIAFFSITAVITLYLSDNKKQPSFKKLNRSISEAEKDLEKEMHYLERSKESYKEATASNKNKIRDAKRKIEIINEQIDHCRRYLELGQDKISAFLFSKACEKFGVNEPFDCQTQLLRNVALEESKEIEGAAFEENEGTDDDYISITCPICGKVSRGILGRVIICETCSSQFEVNMEDGKLVTEVYVK